MIVRPGCGSLVEMECVHGSAAWMWFTGVDGVCSGSAAWMWFTGVDGVCSW